MPIQTPSRTSWERDLDELVSGVIGTPLHLQWKQVRSQIEQITKKIHLSKILKILLSTSGSVTGTLEIITGHPIIIQTRLQKYCFPGDFPTKHLHTQFDIAPDEPLNFREVWLIDAQNGEKLVFAISLTPMNRLDPEFKADLLQADIPIGKLLMTYQIESRREIYELGYRKRYPIFLAEGFQLKNTAERQEIGMEVSGFVDSIHPIPYRCYDIIRQGKIMMKILEYFNPAL